ncbi:MAG: peptide ABC transporter substrate-binding protein [Patescibacteria group bacterium]
MNPSIFLKILKSFSRRELFVFAASFLLFLISLSFLTIDFIESNTKIIPIDSGKYIEGAVGQPSFVNPLIAASGVDLDLIALTFSDLKNLAESYKVDEKGTIWRYRLKEGVFWHDGQPIFSDDIIFSVEAVQNPDAYSPLFQSWRGVKARRISEREVEFELVSPYVFFKNTIEEFRPLPKHIFKDLPAANIRLSEYNLKPIGSGPYKFSAFKKQDNGYIDFYALERNENYFGAKPHIAKFNFAFYQNEESVINAFNKGAIDGFNLTNPDNLSKIKLPHQILSAKSLKYYAIFINQHSQAALNDKNVRFALNQAINKKELVEKVFQNYAQVADGPLVPGAEGIASNSFDPSESDKILEATGWAWGSENIREKTTEKETIKLEFNLTIPEIPFLIETADFIKNSWSKIGVKTNISIHPLPAVNNEIIKARDYQTIIFGNIIGKNSDLFSFWHSSERFYPGLNLALYENSSADKLIESIRQNFNDEKRQTDLASLQSIIVQDYPAIFLFSPDYIYVSKKNLGGFEADFVSLPGERFENIEKWHVKTARVFK